MKFREQRGGLAESMATVVELQNCTEFFAHAARIVGHEVSAETIRVEPYGYDSRINWNTHIVTANGWGVLGFTDGPLPH